MLVAAFRRKAKRGEFRRLGKGALSGAGVIRMSFPFLKRYSGNGGAKLARRVVAATRKSNGLAVYFVHARFQNGAECRWPPTVCKEKVRFLGKKCLLIFQYKFP